MERGDKAILIFTLLVFCPAALFALTPLPQQKPSVDKPPSLQDQLEAQYPPDAAITIQKQGAIGVRLDKKVCPARYQDGKLSYPDSSCTSAAAPWRALAVGEKVKPSTIHVDAAKDVISFAIVDCGPCNPGAGSPYKSQIDFKFKTGYLKNPSVTDVEDTIGEVLAFQEVVPERTSAPATSSDQKSEQPDGAFPGDEPGVQQAEKREIFRNELLSVHYRNLGADVEIDLIVSESISPAILVDVNQNGAVDSGVDTDYAVSKGNPCNAYLYDYGRTSGCGGFISKSTLTMTAAPGGREYAWVIPKGEASTGTNSIHFIVKLYDLRTKDWHVYPSGTFSDPFKINFEEASDEGPQAQLLVQGHYLNEKNSGEYLDLGSNGKFSWKVGGRELSGSWLMHSDALLLRFPPVGATAHAKLDDGRFTCCSSNGLGPDVAALIDDESKSWVRQGDAPDEGPKPGIVSFSVRHRHRTGIDLSNLQPVDSYCSGTLSISPDGTVAYDCTQTERARRCEHLSFAPGALKQVKMGSGGHLHIESKTQGKFDFYGDENDIKQAQAAIAQSLQTAQK